MEQCIRLDLYVRMGGLLENVKWDTSGIWSDKYMDGAKIIACTNKVEHDSVQEPFSTFELSNGRTKKFYLTEVIIPVNFILDPAHTKPSHSQPPH